jgi:energy-converting hydrogenase Eha subunit B
MSQIKLGSKSFSIDSEEIDASGCGVTDAECVALGARMASGEFKRLKILKLVILLVLCICSVHRIVFADSVVQYNNKIGVEGAKAIGAALQVNTSVQELNLVS